MEMSNIRNRLYYERRKATSFSNNGLDSYSVNHIPSEFRFHVDNPIIRQSIEKAIATVPYAHLDSHKLHIDVDCPSEKIFFVTMMTLFAVLHETGFGKFVSIGSV